MQKGWIEENTKKLFSCVLIGVSLLQALSYMSMTLNERDVLRPMQLTDISSFAVHGAEYIPIDSDKGLEKEYWKLYDKKLTYDETLVSVDNWYRNNYAVAVSLTNNTNETQQIEVPLLLYKGYHAYNDAGEEMQISPGKSYRIAVSVPAAFDGSFVVQFKEPWYWRACEIVSLITFIGIIMNIAWRRPKGCIKK